MTGNFYLLYTIFSFFDKAEPNNNINTEERELLSEHKQIHEITSPFLEKNLIRCF